MKTKNVFPSNQIGVLLICLLVSFVFANANANIETTDLVTSSQNNAFTVPWVPLEIQEFEHPISGVKFTIHFVSQDEFLRYGITFQKNYNKDTGVCDWSRGGCWTSSSFILPIDQYPYKLD